MLSEREMIRGEAPDSDLAMLYLAKRERQALECEEKEYQRGLAPIFEHIVQCARAKETRAIVLANTEKVKELRRQKINAGERLRHLEKQGVQDFEEKRKTQSHLRPFMNPNTRHYYAETYDQKRERLAREIEELTAQMREERRRAG